MRNAVRVAMLGLAGLAFAATAVAESAPEAAKAPAKTEKKTKAPKAAPKKETGMKKNNKRSPARKNKRSLYPCFRTPPTGSLARCAVASR